MRMKKCIRPALRPLLFAQRKIAGFQVEVMRRTRLGNKNPIIFAITHIGKWDMEIEYSIPRH